MLLRVSGSVRQSVTWVDQSKRLKLGPISSTLANPSSFADMFHPEIRTSSPECGRQTRVGWGKQATF